MQLTEEQFSNSNPITIKMKMKKKGCLWMNCGLYVIIKLLMLPVFLFFIIAMVAGIYYWNRTIFLVGFLVTVFMYIFQNACTLS
jgi:hypothetical protein